MFHRNRQAEHPDYRKQDRGPTGRPLCRRCLSECPKPRRTFCSDDCVRDFLLAKGGSADVRRYTYKRDHGVCAQCGRDTDQLSRILRLMAHHIGQRMTAEDRGRLNDYLRAAGQTWRWPSDHPAALFWRKAWCDVYSALLMRFGWSARQANDTTKSLWQADHTTPLVEGGDATMANLRTLCVPCHSRQTAALAHRRASKDPDQTDILESAT